MTVQAIRVEDLDRTDEPGAFEIVTTADGKPTGMNILCPCGCGVQAYLSFVDGDPSWQWDGEWDNPSLRPEVAMTSPCGWQGRLTRGNWKSI